VLKAPARLSGYPPGLSVEADVPGWAVSAIRTQLDSGRVFSRLTLPLLLNAITPQISQKPFVLDTTMRETRFAKLR
jgi:hypothetical protein